MKISSPFKTRARRARPLALALFLTAALGSSCRSSQTESNPYGVVVINSPAEGVVRRVLVGEGVEVAQGAPLFEISVERKEEAAAPAASPGESAASRAARRAKAAENAIDAARAEVVRHEAEVQRLTPLVASGQVPQAQLDAERSLYEQAQRRLQQAQDASRDAQSELLSARQPGAAGGGNLAPKTPGVQVETVMARATSAGTVAVISARVGDRVSMGQPLATLRTGAR